MGFFKIMIVLYIWNHNKKKTLKLDDIYYEKKIRENCYFSRTLWTLWDLLGFINMNIVVNRTTMTLDLENIAVHW